MPERKRPRRGVQRVSECPSCGAALPADVERMTQKLLAHLDDERRQRLAAMYQDKAPEMLCAGCFNATLSSLNGAR